MRTRLALGAIAAAATQALATWSIVLIDTRTGEVALGSATCLTGFDLQANTPVIIRGVGGATAQSFVDTTSQNRTLIRDQLALGTHPDDILQLLSTFDAGHQSRQYGIADVLGRSATFSGTGASQWAGGTIGMVGDIVYAVQGNILTGAPVVEAAVQAILDTPGDLPEKLMASMEAARLFGGDGRCSCSPANPTGCGSPPPSFTKSAHIAYMLISRAGDEDSSLGAYRAGSLPRDVLVHDLDADGRPDLLTANSSTSNVSFLRNVTPPGNEFPMFALPVHFAVGSVPQRAALADVTGDGLADVVTSNTSGDSISVLASNGAGSFLPAQTFPSGDGALGIVVAELDGQPGLDVATANQSAGTVAILRNGGTGAFSPPTPVVVGAGAHSIIAGDFDADTDLDLLVTLTGSPSVRFLFNDGTGAFTPGATIVVPTSPTSVVSGDFDGDADLDLAVACNDSQTIVYFFRTPTGFTQANQAIGKRPFDLVAADLDADGDTDLASANAQVGEVTIILNDAGVMSVASHHPLLGTGQQIAAADLDADGDADLIVPSSSNSVLVAHNRGEPRFHAGLGLASGDYFMSFNVAFALLPDPDPVFTLRELFDDWRADLAGRPDAVASTALAEPDVLIADGASGVVSIGLRDWQFLDVDLPAGAVGVEQVSGPALVLGAITPSGSAGHFSASLAPGSVPGVARLRVVVDDGVRPVTLMPEVEVTVIASPDLESDGDFDLFDVMAFQEAYATQDPRADLNADGVVDLKDAAALLTAFASK